MIEISTKKPTAANPSQLIIDVVIKIASSTRHLTRLKWDSGGLYDVPLTWKDGMDTHNSYEASGEMHGKLTRGKLMAYSGEILIGKAEPKTADKEVLLWQRKGQPWLSLKGVEICGLSKKVRRGFSTLSNRQRDIQLMIMNMLIMCTK